MKSIKKALLTLMIPFMGLSLSSCTSMVVYADADKYLVGSQTYTGELKDLDIDWISGEVTLIEDATSENVIVREDNNFSDEKKVHSYFHDGILSIKYWKSGFRSTFIDSKDKHLYVTFPSLENLKLDLTSGKLNADKVTANDIKLSLTSGSMNLGAIKCQEFKANLTSGSININSLEANKGTFNCTSGTIVAGASKANELSFSLTSGKVDLTIPEAGATVTFKKTSGSYQSVRENYTKNDNAYVYGDGACKVSIRITSGKAIVR